ncbi:uncharacterized protein BT62DRAFT_1070840 [Guyanagaster necrorhizus]|uniref:Uncharacterized protein n=1 Tax=Guyanagaster necrorhizus TaxID=856835 RepID=A0A9P7W5X3_9AGAR|nr:uncharacterized protein BT62DRAFT_1070840 [Guyanagaster necrorhizus MCA 3950]KAG7453182.1 hypothetical protein BT62DRAFT_1070840 [Guyanagaster necrorhizus MCA 3950]
MTVTFSFFPLRYPERQSGKTERADEPESWCSSHPWADAYCDEPRGQNDNIEWEFLAFIIEDERWRADWKLRTFLCNDVVSDYGINTIPIESHVRAMQRLEIETIDNESSTSDLCRDIRHRSNTQKAKALTKMRQVVLEKRIGLSCNLILSAASLEFLTFYVRCKALYLSASKAGSKFEFEEKHEGESPCRHKAVHRTAQLSFSSNNHTTTHAQTFRVGSSVSSMRRMEVYQGGNQLPSPQAKHFV